MSTTPAAPAISSVTPILDRVTPAPAPVQTSPKRSKTLVVVALVIILLTVVWIVLMIEVHAVSEFFYEPTQRIQRFMDKALENSLSGHLRESTALWRFWSAWLAIFPVVAVHELGHTAACIFVGFRVIAVRVGRLQISLPFRITWGREGSLPGARGLTRFIPVHSQQLRARALAVCVAGPLANFISALLVFLAVPTLFSVFFVALSIFVGLANLISFQSKALTSDGKRILMLLRNPRSGERWLALTKLLSDLQSGVDYENLSLEFIAIATAVEDDSPDTVTAHTIAFSAAYKKHDDPESARLLEICLQHSGSVGPVLREAAFLNAAIFQAERRKRVEFAEQWLVDLPERSLFPQNRLNAQVAILQTKGDIAGALKKLEESEAIVLRRTPSPRREASLRALQKWRAELLQADSPSQT